MENEHLIQVPRDRVARFAEEWGLEFAEAHDRYSSVVKDLAKNPIIPSEKQIQAIQDSQGTGTILDFVKAGAVLWQRRMCCVSAPEPVEVVFDKPGDYHVHIVDGMAPEVTPVYTSAVSEKLDPGKCPHRWQSRDDLSTAERVIYCELCDWVYSRTTFEMLRSR